MQKPLSAVWNFLLKWAFFSGFYVYVQLFHLKGNEKNLFIVIRVKLLNLHIGAWEKCTFSKCILHLNKYWCWYIIQPYLKCIFPFRNNSLNQSFLLCCIHFSHRSVRSPQLQWRSETETLFFHLYLIRVLQWFCRPSRSSPSQPSS